MSDEMKLRLDVEEFQRAADNLARYSKRDGETFMKEQVRGFIRHLLDFTPPNRGSTRGVKAKKLGEQAVVGDIRVKDGEIQASITNAVSWAGQVNGLRGRVNAALRVQTRSMEKRLLFYFAKVKGKSGWRATSLAPCM